MYRQCRPCTILVRTTKSIRLEAFEAIKILRTARDSILWSANDRDAFTKRTYDDKVTTAVHGVTYRWAPFPIIARTLTVTPAIVWRKAYFFHVRKWRKAYRRVGGDRWRTACVLWLAAVKIGGGDGDGDAEQTWVVIWAMNRTQQERCRWVQLRRKFALSTRINSTQQ